MSCSMVISPLACLASRGLMNSRTSARPSRRPSSLSCLILLGISRTTYPTPSAMIADSDAAPADAANVAGAVLADLAVVAGAAVAEGQERVELLRGDLSPFVAGEDAVNQLALFGAGFLDFGASFRASLLPPFFLELFDSSRY